MVSSYCMVRQGQRSSIMFRMLACGSHIPLSSFSVSIYERMPSLWLQRTSFAEHRYQLRATNQFDKNYMHQQQTWPTIDGLYHLNASCGMHGQVGLSVHGVHMAQECCNLLVYVSIQIYVMLVSNNIHTQYI